MSATGIKVIGSLNSEKECQDRVRVFDGGGALPHYEQQTTKTHPKYSKSIPINEDSEGICRTLKSQYYKVSAANFDRQTAFGASGVLTIYDE